MNILVIGGEAEVQTQIQTVLEEKEYQVGFADTISSGHQKLDQNASDAVIVDLEAYEDLEICHDLLKEQSSMPVLILSVKDDTDVKVKCLNAGADDYITKPFDPLELAARVGAISRRYSLKNGTGVISRGELMVNKIDRTCTINDNVTRLTNNELDLLVYLMERSETIVSRFQLSKDIWGITHHTPSNFVNVYISYLRKKIQKYTDFKYIKTIRSEGFVFTEPE